MLRAEPAPIQACTVARDIEYFDLLIEDMEAELHENWGDLNFEEAAAYLRQPDAEALEFIVIAVDENDEENIPVIADLVRVAKEREIKVILIADDVTPVTLHKLLRLGANDFVPYPLPEGALHEAIERVRSAPAAETIGQSEALALKGGPVRDGIVLPVHGLAGGTGATTFAVNLAWELANAHKKMTERVCLLDFDLQFGSTSTFLDLPRREAVFELLSDVSVMDQDAFLQSLVTFNEKLHVLTAPPEMLPLDLISGEDVQAIIDMARANFDFVIVDMPKSVVQWTETVLNAAQAYFTMLELDMRSAQNALRFIRALRAEELPVEKLRFVMNRAPKFTDLSGRSRVKRMAESLDIKIEVQLPDGGKQVVQAGDHGLPLAETAAKNPLRKEIRKLAESLYELGKSQAEASA